jgi:hypothetical protein
MDLLNVTKGLLMLALLSSILGFAEDNTMAPFNDPWFIPVVFVLVLNTYKTKNG